MAVKDVWKMKNEKAERKSYIEVLNRVTCWRSSNISKDNKAIRITE